MFVLFPDLNLDLHLIANGYLEATDKTMFTQFLVVISIMRYFPWSCESLASELKTVVHSYLSVNSKTDTWELIPRYTTRQL